MEPAGRGNTGARDAVWMDVHGLLFGVRRLARKNTGTRSSTPQHPFKRERGCDGLEGTSSHCPSRGVIPINSASEDVLGRRGKQPEWDAAVSNFSVGMARNVGNK